MTSILSIPHHLDRAALTCRAIIETPKGSRTKYDFDPETGLFLLDKVLPEGMCFPLDFGFIPSTKAEDGDPVDILVLHEEPIPVGVILEVRLIGVIIGEQQEEEDRAAVRNDRLVGVANVSRLHHHIGDLQQLGDQFVEQLARFWVNYNDLQGRTFEIKDIQGPGEAAALIEAASLT